MLRKWVIDGEHRLVVPVTAAPPVPETPSAPTPTFVPLVLPAPTDDGEIRIELQRAGTAVKIVWPAAVSVDS